MNEDTPSVNSNYILKKFPGKGGWTYAEIPEIPQDKNNPFGWVVVSGSIDGIELKKYKLMPMGNGNLFLPVKAKLRKQLGKEEGDSVKIILKVDKSPLEIPEEIIQCFEIEDKSKYETFLSFEESEQKAYLDWIYEAKTDETKETRIIKMMERLGKKLKFYDKEIIE